MQATLKRRKYMIAICAMAAFPYNAHAVGPSVNVDVPLDKIAEKIGDGIAWLFNRWDKGAEQARRDSVFTLSLQISNLAGQELALAHNIQTFADDPNSAKGHFGANADQVTAELNRQLAAIKTQFSNISMILGVLDPAWAARNPGIVVDVGMFAHDGMLFYTTSFSQIWLTDSKATSKMATDLRQEVEQLRSLSDRLRVLLAQ